MDLQQVCKRVPKRPLPTTYRNYSCGVMNDDDYNGWANRATWNVNIWLANDNYTHELMSSLKMTDSDQFENFCHYIWKDKTPDGCLLSEVDWQEIAENWCHRE